MLVSLHELFEWTDSLELLNSLKWIWMSNATKMLQIRLFFWSVNLHRSSEWTDSVEQIYFFELVHLHESSEWTDSLEQIRISNATYEFLISLLICKAVHDY